MLKPISEKQATALKKCLDATSELKDDIEKYLALFIDSSIEESVPRSLPKKAALHVAESAMFMTAAQLEPDEGKSLDFANTRTKSSEFKKSMADLHSKITSTMYDALEEQSLDLTDDWEITAVQVGDA